MSRIQEILDRVNAYEDTEPPHECGPDCETPCTAPDAPSVYTDVIYGLPEYDQDVSRGAAATGAAGFGLIDGTLIIFDGQLRQWVVMDPKTGEYVDQS